MKRLNRDLGFAVLCAIFILTSVSFADAAESDQRIEEIKVTARKREESMQTVPISVSAFTATDLNEMQVTEAKDIADLTPNLMINRSASGSSAVVTCMRGLCRTDTTITDDPYVGIYMDGIYTGKAVGSVFELADIERIEVLRGPQGTLFGKNTIGGAVNVISAKPSGEAGVKLSAFGGNWDQQSYKAVVDTPTIAGFSTKVAFLKKSHDHFTENKTGINDYGNEDREALLFNTLWQPTDRFSANYVFDWSRNREQPFANFSTQNNYGTEIHTHRVKRTSLYDEAPSVRNNLDDYGHSLTLDLDLGDYGVVRDSTLKSITGYRYVKNAYTDNSSGLAPTFEPFPGFPLDLRFLWTQDNFRMKTVTQELQYAGSAFDGAVDFLLGGFYSVETGDYSNNQGMVNWLIGIPGFDSNDPVNTVTTTHIRYASYAFFTEDTWHITDTLSLTAGVRFTNEARDGVHDGQTTIYPVTGPVEFPPFLEVPRKEFNSTTWSPRLALSWQATDDTMLYGGWSRGYKSGGFNARSIELQYWGPYDDMRADSYEVGAKNTLWDGKAQLNIAAFLEDLHHPQVQFNGFPPGSSNWNVVLESTGDARIWGAELEAIVRPLEGLELNAGFGWIHDRYTSPLINPFTQQDEQHMRHMEFSPAYSWNLSGRYIFPGIDVGVLALRVDYTGSSPIGFNTAIADDKIVGQGAYGLVDARLGLSNVKICDLAGTFDFALIGKNLTDRSYKTGGYGSNVFGFYTNIYGDPRTYGAQVTWRWGSQEG